MNGVSNTLVQELRLSALQSASVPDMLRLLHQRLGCEAAYSSTVAKYFMAAFDLPLRAVSPIGGWAPESSGEISDSRVHELVYPEIMRKKAIWGGANLPVSVNAKEEETALNASLRLPKARVFALEPSELAAYLQAHGWKADQRASSAEAEVYRLLPDSAAEVLLPLDKGFADYALRVSELLQTLAAIERRRAWEVLEDLSARQAPSTASCPRDL
jgi:hypothetical protein